MIRETIREMDKVAIGRLVLTNREQIITLEAVDTGLIGTTLRYPYEVRDPAEYFDGSRASKLPRIGARGGAEAPSDAAFRRSPQRRTNEIWVGSGLGKLFVERDATFPSDAADRTERAFLPNAQCQLVGTPPGESQSGE
jgi:hypothetical protein